MTGRLRPVCIEVEARWSERQASAAAAPPSGCARASISDCKLRKQLFPVPVSGSRFRQGRIPRTILYFYRPLMGMYLRADAARNTITRRLTLLFIVSDAFLSRFLPLSISVVSRAAPVAGHASDALQGPRPRPAGWRHPRPWLRISRGANHGRGRSLRRNPWIWVAAPGPMRVVAPGAAARAREAPRGRLRRPARGSVAICASLRGFEMGWGANRARAVAQWTTPPPPPSRVQIWRASTLERTHSGARCGILRWNPGVILGLRWDSPCRARSEHAALRLPLGWVGADEASDVTWVERITPTGSNADPLGVHPRPSVTRLAWRASDALSDDHGWAARRACAVGNKSRG
ncbi:hypothetical protein GGX14DRAFT_569185 [Mycena pura]|uniref:Uncharacterized protein n=1 Tax=Mycena pura TaxID=153505 RepID=A0AAD6Y738_9AGAR|nr:hypothetical protein GGX14DRAFT_569185 [Mycena pura]